MGLPSDQSIHPNQPHTTNEPLHPVLIGLLIICALLIPILGPIASLITGITARQRAGALPLLVIGVIMLILNIVGVFIAALAIPNLVDARGRARDAETKANSHTIQIALERYYTDKREYPIDSQILIDETYVTSFPNNSYTSDEMVDIEFGTNQPQGNFTYIPILIKDIVVGYYLMSYGNGDFPGEDVDSDGTDDQVILVLDSNWDGTDKLPELSDLLN